VDTQVPRATREVPAIVERLERPEDLVNVVEVECLENPACQASRGHVGILARMVLMVKMVNRERKDTQAHLVLLESRVRVDMPECEELPERPDHGERLESREALESLDRKDTLESPERMEKVDPPELVDTAERVEHAEHPEHPERPVNVESQASPEHVDTLVRMVCPEREVTLVSVVKMVKMVMMASPVHVDTQVQLERMERMVVVVHPERPESLDRKETLERMDIPEHVEALEPPEPLVNPVHVENQVSVIPGLLEREDTLGRMERMAIMEWMRNRIKNSWQKC
jgi:hypothetical protein